MSLSLTKEEFLDRLGENHQIILIAWQKELNEGPQAPLKMQINAQNGIDITPLINEKISGAIAKLLLRAIDYIYREDE